jgi:hypothetical protein
VDLLIRSFGNYSLKQNAVNGTYDWMQDSLDAARFLQAMPFFQQPGALIMAAIDGNRSLNEPNLDCSHRIVFVSYRSYFAIARLLFSIGIGEKAEIKGDDESTRNEDRTLLFRKLCVFLFSVFPCSRIFLDIWVDRGIKVISVEFSFSSRLQVFLTDGMGRVIGVLHRMGLISYIHGFLAFRFS